MIYGILTEFASIWDASDKTIPCTELLKTMLGMLELQWESIDIVKKLIPIVQKLSRQCSFEIITNFMLKCKNGEKLFDLLDTCCQSSEYRIIALPIVDIMSYNMSTHKQCANIIHDILFDQVPDCFNKLVVCIKSYPLHAPYEETDQSIEWMLKVMVQLLFADSASHSKKLSTIQDYELFVNMLVNENYQKHNLMIPFIFQIYGYLLENKELYQKIVHMNYFQAIIVDTYVRYHHNVIVTAAGIALFTVMKSPTITEIPELCQTFIDQICQIDDTRRISSAFTVSKYILNICVLAFVRERFRIGVPTWWVNIMKVMKTFDTFDDLTSSSKELDNHIRTVWSILKELLNVDSPIEIQSSYELYSVPPPSEESILDQRKRINSIPIIDLKSMELIFRVFKKLQKSNYQNSIPISLGDILHGLMNYDKITVSKCIFNVPSWQSTFYLVAPIDTKIWTIMETLLTIDKNKALIFFQNPQITKLFFQLLDNGTNKAHVGGFVSLFTNSTLVISNLPKTLVINELREYYNIIITFNEKFHHSLIVKGSTQLLRCLYADILPIVYDGKDFELYQDKVITYTNWFKDKAHAKRWTKMFKLKSLTQDICETMFTALTVFTMNPSFLTLDKDAKLVDSIVNVISKMDVSIIPLDAMLVLYHIGKQSETVKLLDDIYESLDLLVNIIRKGSITSLIVHYALKTLLCLLELDYGDELSTGDRNIYICQTDNGSNGFCEYIVSTLQLYSKDTSTDEQTNSNIKLMVELVANITEDCTIVQDIFNSIVNMEETFIQYLNKDHPVDSKVIHDAIYALMNGHEKNLLRFIQFPNFFSTIIDMANNDMKEAQDCGNLPEILMVSVDFLLQQSTITLNQPKLQRAWLDCHRIRDSDDNWYDLISKYIVRYCAFVTIVDSGLTLLNKTIFDITEPFVVPFVLTKKHRSILGDNMENFVMIVKTKWNESASNGINTLIELFCDSTSYSSAIDMCKTLNDCVQDFIPTFINHGSALSQALLVLLQDEGNSNEDLNAILALWEKLALSFHNSVSQKLIDEANGQYESFMKGLQIPQLVDTIYLLRTTNPNDYYEGLFHIICESLSLVDCKSDLSDNEWNNLYILLAEHSQIVLEKFVKENIAISDVKAIDDGNKFTEMHVLTVLQGLCFLNKPPNDKINVQLHTRVIGPLVSTLISVVDKVKSLHPLLSSKIAAMVVTILACHVTACISINMPINENLRVSLCLDFIIQGIKCSIDQEGIFLLSHWSTSIIPMVTTLLQHDNEVVTNSIVRKNWVESIIDDVDSVDANKIEGLDTIMIGKLIYTLLFVNLENISELKLSSTTVSKCKRLLFLTCKSLDAIPYGEPQVAKYYEQHIDDYDLILTAYNTLSGENDVNNVEFANEYRLMLMSSLSKNAKKFAQFQAILERVMDLCNDSDDDKQWFHSHKIELIELTISAIVELQPTCYAILFMFLIHPDRVSLNI